jgi:hypothetical protein
MAPQSGASWAIGVDELERQRDDGTEDRPSDGAVRVPESASAFRSLIMQ